MIVIDESYTIRYSLAGYSQYADFRYSKGVLIGHSFTLSEPIILTMTIDDPIEGIWSAIQEVGSLRGNITEAEFEPIN